MTTHKNKFIFAGVAAAAATGTIAYSAYKAQRRAHKYSKWTKIDLLPSERSAVISLTPPTTVCTFYRGNTAAAIAYLEEKVADIVTANPWLCAVLDRDEINNIVAYYPPVLTKRFRVATEVTLCRESTYQDIVNAVKPLGCRSSVQSEGNDTPLWNVTLVPDSKEPESRFAVVVSANHTLMDGHGFYRIYAMLSRDVEIVALNSVRNAFVPAAIQDVMGGEVSILNKPSFGFIARFLFASLRSAFKPDTKVGGFQVSRDWVQQQKLKPENDGVPFVSSNDVLMSKFCTAFQPPAHFASMTVNFRGRVELCREDDVCNYEDLILYTPADYASPSLIRKSISNGVYRRAASPPTKLPTNWQYLTGTSYAAVTNWSTFYSSVDIDEAVEELHMPIFDFPETTPSSAMGAMVIFRPKPDSIAVLFGGSKQLVDSLMQSGMVGARLERIDF